MFEGKTDVDRRSDEYPLTFGGYELHVLRNLASTVDFGVVLASRDDFASVRELLRLEPTIGAIGS